MKPIRLLQDSFELEEEVGRGAFGVVHRARNLETDKSFAVKLAHQRESPEQRARILREVQLLQGIEAPNLVRLDGVFLDSNRRLALVYEYVEGEDLDVLRDQRTPRIEQVLRWCRELAAGVDALHERGIVHRDLKPQNLRVEPSGRLKILDYGLARGEQSGGTLTGTGLILGTPRYMAGEAFLGAVPDRSQDLFSMAAVLYWMLEGQVPFPGQDLATIHSQRQRGPAPLSLSPWTGNRALDAVFGQGLSAEPRDRFRSAGDLFQALEAALTQPQDSDNQVEEIPTLKATIQLPERVAPREAGAGTTKIRRRPPRPVRLTILLVGVLLGWFLLPPEAVNPPPCSEAGSPLGEDGIQESSGPDWGPLGEGFAILLREELTDRAGQVDPITRRLLVDPDPLSWRRVIEAWPRLRRFYRWMEQGGRPWGLEESQRAELRRCDQWFEDQDLPRPFFPFAYGLRPIEDPVPFPQSLLDRLDAEVGDPVPRSQIRGWYGRSMETLAKIVEVVDRRTEDLQKGCPEFLDPAIYFPLGFRGYWDRHGLVTIADGVYSAGEGAAAAESRRQLERWFSPASRLTSEFFFFLGRSLEEEPETREELAVISTGFLRYLKPLLYSARGLTPPAWWLGGLPSTPDARLVQGRLWMLQRQHSLFPVKDDDPEIEWLRDAFQTPGGLTEWAPARRDMSLILLFESYQERGEKKELESLLMSLRPGFEGLREDLKRRLLLAACGVVVEQGDSSRLQKEDLRWLLQQLQLLQESYGRQAIREHAEETLIPELERMLERHR